MNSWIQDSVKEGELMIPAIWKSGMLFVVLLMCCVDASGSSHGLLADVRAHGVDGIVESILSRADTVQKDTLDLPQYYQFIQYYDSSMVIFTFGEFHVHRQGSAWHTGLWNFSLYNRPLPENSLAALYEISGSPPLRYRAGDSITFYKSMYIEGENIFTGGNYLGVEDTIVYYLEVLNVNSGSILDTVNCWGILPQDSATNIPVGWVRCSPDTSVVAHYIVPDFGMDEDEFIQFRIRPVFKGDPDRLAIVRWDVLEPSPLSEGGIAVKHAFSEWFDALVDSLSKQSHLDERASLAEGFITNWSLQTNTISVHVPAGNEITYIALYTVTGRELERKRIPSAVATLVEFNTGNLPGGIYFVVAHSDNAPIISNRIEVVR
jgi:hypothetical protein